MNKTKPIVICGFSGIGKSYAAKEFNEVLDLESSVFSRIWDEGKDMGKNPVFPKNYVDAIEGYLKEPYGRLYILVSCHEEVREELRNRGIDYIIACPKLEHRNEYIKRWVTRGSDIKFIRKMYDNWEDMLQSCADDPMPKIVCNYDTDTLADMLSMHWDIRITRSDESTLSVCPKEG
jgi:hypothetical protein